MNAGLEGLEVVDGTELLVTVEVEDELSVRPLVVEVVLVVVEGTGEGTRALELTKLVPVASVEAVVAAELRLGAYVVALAMSLSDTVKGSAVIIGVPPSGGLSGASHGFSAIAHP